jgi:hypothetical protein
MATATPKPTVLDGHEVREMTDTELAQLELDKAEAVARAEAEAAQAAAKQSVLDRLGITADEARMLLS